MRSTLKRKARIIAYIPYQNRHLGFVLPVLEIASDPGCFFVQELNETGDGIVGFKELQFEASDLIYIAVQTDLTAGARPYYVFIDEFRSISCGTIENLKSTLSGFVTRMPNETAIALQIIELIGTKSEKKIFRLKMREKLLLDGGIDIARYFYEGSVLRQVTWNLLIDFFNDTESIARVASKRSVLLCQLSESGNLEIDLSALDACDLAKIDVSVLKNKITEEFETAPLSPTNPISWQAELQISAEDATSVTEILERVKAAERQERRIAIFVEAILRNREVGVLALRIYRRDRGKFATVALEELRRLFINPRLMLGPPNNDIFYVLKYIKKLYRNHHNLSRGPLLLSLAKELGNYNSIANLIRELLSGSNSSVMSQFKDDILTALLGHENRYDAINRKAKQV